MRFKRLLFIFFFFIINGLNLVYGQLNFNYGSASTTVGSNELSGSPSEVISINPASMMGTNGNWSGILSSQRLYNTDILNLSAAVIHSLDKSSIGLQLGAYGINGFKRSAIHGSYAMKLNHNIQLGVQVSYYQLSIEDIGTTSSTNTSVGFLHSLSPKWSYALTGHNLLENRNKTGIPRFFHTSVKHEVSELLSLFAALYFIPAQPPSFRPGFRYKAMNYVHLKMAFDTDSDSFSYGIDIQVNTSWKLITAFSSHQRLGTSLAVSIVYSRYQDY